MLIQIFEFFCCMKIQYNFFLIFERLDRMHDK